ncbi:4'-phosphopantetheinyl transferase superfamily protein [Streptomyces sp. HNM0663]|uniref:4'-phosphopantetheinyl transferase superfamily protein n=1 Tax=Streptomyces chengmaiensis TaxID=3040919 RepID=A0ABT6HG87_9ACTN|nr:4'-phosphopantetheinyl transferase superfamily protein [Streptomyces chengmaiensis]MDH2387779.1 4'-phosphopantetheinyl transferase superfamily protein [Streptomyces chengmaiensis]
MSTYTPVEPARPLPGVELVWSGLAADHRAHALAHRHVLDAEETARLTAFVRDRDRDTYAVAHVALRELLGERLGLPPREVPLARLPCVSCGGPHGRPHVPGDPVHFSLSHAHDAVLIAIAEQAVGIDVEALPAPATALDVAAQLHSAERTELRSLGRLDRSAELAAAFARCWTRKEALLKAKGVGLNEELTLTYVGTGPRPAPQNGWLLADLPAPTGCAAAVAVAAPDQAPHGATGIKHP